LSSEKITHVLNGVLQAVATVVPVPSAPQKPTMISEPIAKAELGVLIGLTGDVRGRLFFGSSSQTFSKLGESMFGMPLEGDMLRSFVGELGNMIGGNTAAGIYSKGMMMDITPPTVMEGDFKLYGFKSALVIGVDFDKIGCLQMTVLIDDNE
jgi:chemotaxis protein CheX